MEKSGREDGGKERNNPADRAFLPMSTRSGLSAASLECNPRCRTSRRVQIATGQRPLSMLNPIIASNEIRRIRTSIATASRVNLPKG